MLWDSNTILSALAGSFSTVWGLKIELGEHCIVIE